MKWTRVAGQCAILAAVAMTMLLQACGQSAATAQLALLPQSALPAFPVERGASVNVPMSQNGAAAFDTSAGALPSGNNLLLPGSTGAVEYGLYQFGTNGDPLVELSIAKAPPPSSSYFVGIANYASLRWEIRGPFSTATNKLQLSGANYTSPANNFYAFVAVFGGANVTLQTITLTVDSSLPTFALSGQVTEGVVGLSAVTVDLGGDSTASTQTDAQGNYSFSGLIDGAYSVTPSRTSYTFLPVSQNVNIAGANAPGVDFSGSAAAGSFDISGFVAEVGGFPPIPGTTMTLTPGGQQVIVGAGPGAYTFTGIANGSYTVTPTFAGYTFNPTSRPVTVAGADVTNVDFEGTAAPTTYETGDGLIQALVNTHCSPCHISQSSGGRNFSTFANITSSDTETRIIVRAVTEQTMPPSGMPQSERDKLQAWMDDGFLQ